MPSLSLLLPADRAAFLILLGAADSTPTQSWLQGLFPVITSKLREDR